MERSGVTIAHTNQTDTVDYVDNPVCLNRIAITIQSKQIRKCVHSLALRARSLFFLNFKSFATLKKGTAVAQWLRCCATNRKVAGSIPTGVIGIFH